MAHAFEYKVQPEDKIECHQGILGVVQTGIKTTGGWWCSATKAGKCVRMQRKWHIVAFIFFLAVTTL